METNDIGWKYASGYQAHKNFHASRNKEYMSFFCYVPILQINGPISL